MLKIIVFLTTALALSVFIGENFLVAGTFEIKPETRRNLAALPQNFGRLIPKFAVFPDYPQPTPKIIPVKPSRPSDSIRIPSPVTDYPEPTATKLPSPTTVKIPSLAPTAPPANVNKDDFARCLTQNGLKMYGTETCGACQYQKNLFGSSFSYITYIKCNESPLCSQKGVRATPTWEDAAGQLYPGARQLTDLGKIAGCAPPG